MTLKALDLTTIGHALKYEVTDSGLVYSMPRAIIRSNLEIMMGVMP